MPPAARAARPPARCWPTATRVRALVRDPDAAAAEALAALGVELVVGDLDDRDSLIAAASGARAVFSVQLPRFTGEAFDYDGEVTQGVNLVESAKAAGVAQFVHTSASGVGQHVDHPGWTDTRWPLITESLTAKQAVQDRVRTAGFASWTLLKPGFFMDNFRPSMAFLFPRGIEGGLVSVLHPDTRLSLVATQDIGAAAAAAFAAPERFDGVEARARERLPLDDGDRRRALRRAGHAAHRAGHDRRGGPRGGVPLMGTGHDFMNVVGQPARPQLVARPRHPIDELR